jgi:D-glycero-alpha-D-manno-heptose-7-phosphate kinase
MRLSLPATKNSVPWVNSLQNSMARSGIVATASCRVDLAGGTLDIWPLYLFHPGALTVNFALNILTRCTIIPHRSREILLRSIDTGRQDRFADAAALLAARKYNHPLAGHLCREFMDQGGRSEGFVLTTSSSSPAGAGISGSSALMVATTAALAAWHGSRLSKEQIRVIAQNVEARLICVPTGCQDYYPALYGGVNAIRLDAKGLTREPLAVPFRDIESRFVLVYTGAPRQSGINNWEVFQAHINGDRRVLRNFDQIAAIAREMRNALAARRWNEVGALLRAEWKLRKTNAPGITTPLIEKLVTAAQKNGGIAAKVCGAGGGGCLIVFAEPDAKPAVIRALQSNRGEVLPFRVARSGLRVRSISE